MEMLARGENVLEVDKRDDGVIVEKFQMKNYERFKFVIMRLKIKGKKNLQALKHNSNGRLVNWLKAESIMMTINR